MNDKKTICLISDHPKRDLKGILLLGSTLVRRGFRVIITPLNLANHEVWKICPNLIHLPYLRPNNESFILNLIEAGIEYTVLDNEGGVLEDLAFLSNSLPKNPKVVEKCAHFFTWAKPQRDYLIKHSQIEQNRISATGHPRFDFYSEKLNKTLHKAEVQKYEKFILINSTFCFSNPRFTSPEIELQNAVKVHGANFTEVKVIQEQELIAQKNFIKLIKKLSEHYKNINFIYRPHPFESDKIYIEEFSGFKNIAVTNMGTVDSWIYHSIAIIQLKCSTAFEAHMLHKPTLLPIWIGNLSGDKRINELSELIQTEDELIFKMDSILNGTYQTKKEIEQKKDAILEDIYLSIDGLAHKRVAEVIELILNKSSFHPNQQKCKSLISTFSISESEPTKVKLIKKILRYSFFNFIIKKLKILERLAVYKWSKSDKFFDLNTVNKIINEINDLTEQKELIKARYPDIKYGTQSIELF